MTSKTGLVAFLVVFAVAGGAMATTAEFYFSSDRNGESRVTSVQEGREVWLAVYDPDENIDCDVRDKIWTDAKLMDPKTGAYIVWKSYADATGSPAGHPYGDAEYVPYRGHFPGDAGYLGADYFEETGADTGLFVSRRAFRLGTREDYAVEPLNTHVVDVPSSPPDEFEWGAYLYSDIRQEDVPLKVIPGVEGDMQRWIGSTGGGSPLAYAVGLVDVPYDQFEMPSELDGADRGVDPSNWLVGRFENMDTLVGLYQDPDDAGDVAVGMMKIVDTSASLSWNREIYPDANETATITVSDPDENLDCDLVEYVPVFILVDPGSWNPAGTVADPEEQTNDSPNNFCMLKRTGGVAGDTGEVGDYRPIRWFNIYNAEKNDFGTAGAQDGRYYVQYPKLGVDDLEIHKTLFDTVSADGITAVSFYAQETAPDSGVFQLNLNSILDDLGFRSLDVRDVLVAYYLDPNDEDDFGLATAYIGQREPSSVQFTDASQATQDLYWIGRNAVYVRLIDSDANVDPCCPEQVIVHICDPHEEDDGEFWVLHETGSNSAVFFSTAGMELLPTWDALGVGLPDLLGGYQLVLDNWRLEVFNEDKIYVRYNDVEYRPGDNGYAGLADSDTTTAYSGPRIDHVRVSNDVSFDIMSIADTQVYDGDSTNMYFLDRSGNRVSGYVNNDCVFIEVVDPDQNEDESRRERVEAFWDGGQNFPFGPLPLNPFGCAYERTDVHPVNSLLGDTNIYNDSPDPYPNYPLDGAAKVYVLNPRSGRWAALDLLETGAGSGDFVSVICVDLTAVVACVPTLDALPGDTILAVYSDPSNHSDSAWISIKVGIGGGTPATSGSTTEFVDAEGNDAPSYAQGEAIYVRVTDPSHTAGTLPGALTVEGAPFDLVAVAGQPGVFMTGALPLTVAPGEILSATYVDPNDPTDSSTDTAAIVACELTVERFYASPNPFEDEVVFGYVGSGAPTSMRVAVYDLSGHEVWRREAASVSSISWDGTDGSGNLLANGGYVYCVTAVDGTRRFDGTGLVFLNR
jgi:hypothetical protein